MSFSESWRSPRPAPGLNAARRRMPPKPRIPNWLRAWWPALLWAAIIFLLSTDSFSSAHTAFIIEPLLRWLFPSISQNALNLAHHLVRKSAHFTEYFIFFLLLYHGIRGNRRGWHWSWVSSPGSLRPPTQCSTKFTNPSLPPVPLPPGILCWTPPVRSSLFLSSSSSTASSRA